ncbi:hypothetical protein HanRHA438_Chr11g0513261 [Helianthus annuus]|nr:hypothetical protein HanRHA438_Chr11g0513261 [Helianthus annuus]
MTKLPLYLKNHFIIKSIIKYINKFHPFTYLSLSPDSHLSLPNHFLSLIFSFNKTTTTVTTPPQPPPSSPHQHRSTTTSTNTAAPPPL